MSSIRGRATQLRTLSLDPASGERKALQADITKFADKVDSFDRPGQATSKSGPIFSRVWSGVRLEVRFKRTKRREHHKPDRGCGYGNTTWHSIWH